MRNYFIYVRILVYGLHVFGIVIRVDYYMQIFLLDATTTDPDSQPWQGKYDTVLRPSDWFEWFKLDLGMIYYWMGPTISEK
jgi:hypothetical protein